MGDGVLRNMVLLLHSSNENLSVEDGERFIYALMPGQEASVDVRLFVATTAEVFFSLSRFKNGDTFFRANSSLHQIIIEETMPVTDIKAV